MVGVVMLGAVFGYHASPISDTTIISSLAAGCDVIEHTHSQLRCVLLAAFDSAMLFAVFGILGQS